MESLIHEDDSYCNSGTMSSGFLQANVLKGSRSSLASNKTMTSLTPSSIYKSVLTLSMGASQMLKKSYGDLLNAQALNSGSQTDFTSLSSDGYDAPDSGFAWVVLIAAIYIVLVSMIPTTSVGILYVELIQIYDNREVIAWMCSIQTALLCLASPIVAIISQKLGAKVTCLIGTTGITLCLVATAHLKSLPATFAIFGVILGFFTCMIYIPAITFPNRYFVKQKMLAMSIAITIGGGLAFIVFPYLIKLVTAYFGWRAALYFLAGCSAQGVVASMLLREPRFKAEDKCPNEKDENGMLSGQANLGSQQCNMEEAQKSSSYLHTETEDIHRKIQANRVLNGCEHPTRQTELLLDDGNEKDEQTIQQCLETIVENKPWIPPQCTVNSRSRSNTVESVKLAKRLRTNVHGKMPMEQNATSSDILEKTECQSEKKCSCTTQSAIKLGIYIVCITCWGWGAGTFHVLFNDYALFAGHSDVDVSIMYLLMGVSAVVFRIAFCILGGLAPGYNKFFASSITYIIQGLSIMAILSFNNLIVYNAAVVLFSGMFGWSAGLVGTTVLDIKLEAHLEASIAALWLSYGVGYLLAAPFSVFLMKIFGVYEMALGHAIASYSLAAILTAAVYIWDRCSQSCRDGKSQDSVSQKSYEP